jgi:hypothetical protein
MKTAVIGEDEGGLVVYNRGLVDLARHYGFHPRACRPYRAKTKGKVERPFRYIREDFFLGGAFHNLDDLNGQLRHWLDVVANPRVHATTRRVVNEAFAEEKASLRPLPAAPYQAVLRLERRASHEGMLSMRQSLQRARHDAPARLRCPCARRRHPHLRGGRARSDPCSPRRPRPEAARSFASQSRRSLSAAGE